MNDFVGKLEKTIVCAKKAAKKRKGRGKGQEMRGLHRMGSFSYPLILHPNLPGKLDEIFAGALNDVHSTIFLD